MTRGINAPLPSLPFPARYTQTRKTELNPNKPVSDEPEVREWLLGRSDLALRPGEEVGEVDEEPAVALPLVRRQSQDARHVEVLQARRLVIQCGREISGACYIK